MSFDTGAVISEAAERLATTAGAVLVALLTIPAVIQAAAEQDLTREAVTNVLELLREEDPELAEEFEPVADEALANLPLALGVDAGTAGVIWTVGVLLTLVVTVLAIDAFGHERDGLTDVGLGSLGWKALNLLVGTFVFGLLFAVGTALLVLPGLALAVLLVFFPAAIVLDGESFVDAFGTSIDIVRDQPLGALGLVVVAVVAWIGLGIAAATVGIALPPVTAAVVTELLSSVGFAFALALIARGYLAATADRVSTDDGITSQL